ncbi:MAG: class II fructose-bisphosphate aldolase [Patescibacteria group bacterium]|jgi:fructose-bisphosphate aldolase class II
MITHLKNIVSSAQRGKYALGAFNTSNLEVTLGIIRGAAAQKSPVIVQVSESTIKYAGLTNITELIKIIAANDGKKIPIAIHLDHGHTFQIVADCVKAGFSSVHIDGSDLPFEKNIALTKKAAIFAHRHGVWAQAELGAMLGKEGTVLKNVPKDPNAYMTDPAKVKEFVRRTGADTLAISVGTMHGYYQGREKIDFPRLKKIQQEIPQTPLVLHGASGLSDSDLRSAAKFGVRIVNIDTDLRRAFTQALRRTIKTAPKNHYDPRQILKPSIEAVAAETERLIKLFGSGR